MKVDVPLKTAVLGGEADVKTLAVKSLRLKIPPTTQNGQVFRLRSLARASAVSPRQYSATVGNSPPHPQM